MCGTEIGEVLLENDALCQQMLGPDRDAGILPPRHLTFAGYNALPPSDCRVVIFGQVGGVVRGYDRGCGCGCGYGCGLAWRGVAFYLVP